MRKLRMAVPGAAAGTVDGSGGDGGFDLDSLDGGRAAREQAKAAEAAVATAVAEAVAKAVSSAQPSPEPVSFDPDPGPGLGLGGGDGGMDLDAMINPLAAQTAVPKVAAGPVPMDSRSRAEVLGFSLASSAADLDGSVAEARKQAERAAAAGQPAGGDDGRAAESALLFRALAKAGLAGFAVTVAEAGIATLGDLAATDDDTLKTKLGLSRMQHRKLRASIAALAPGAVTAEDIDGSTLGTLI